MVSHLEELERRSRHLNTTCLNNDLLNATTREKKAKVLFLSKVYNVACCKVPKAGSTFWTIFFAVLDNGVEFGKKLLGENRGTIHKGQYTFFSSFKYVKSKKYPTILPARDPYSRLFSAFIDKIYLLVRFNYNYAILSIQNKSVCPTDVSFQDFLPWIVNETKEGKTLDRHWAPIYSICGSCEVNAQYVVKQETFAIDIDIVLQKLNVSSAKHNYIMQTLEGTRIQSSLPGIVAAIFDHSSGSNVRRCMPWVEVTRKIWRSFQIQGYIREDRRYPQGTFDSIGDNLTPSLVSDLILAEIFKFSMSSEERQIQRENALRRAYEGVRKDVVDAIKDVYALDFSLYGYSNLPPHER
ncbi:carbohydrate sulfotransferase 12-like isoform X4 [Dreissena polymorpha]|nr:carbohydrate sulfotransferase 12-like isoform X4 [Dreissena polymorpha]